MDEAEEAVVQLQQNSAEEPEAVAVVYSTVD